MSGLDLIGGSNSLAAVGAFARLDLAGGTHDVAGATKGLYVTNIGWLDVFGLTTINNTAAGADDTIIVIGQSAASISGNVTANGDEGSVVNVAENSRVNITGDIDAVQCENGSAMEWRVRRSRT
ncbi:MULTISPECIES: hypothetical protein [Halolamina]|uniref:Uncharacterized protein n=1 Tax=Halolamina pelagica TaxID=699431 RepID=A0A1I5U274_9EURY|nr:MULTISPECIES: hypothetical protein [Halolamina]NHX36761.1 hypothetical protein [Halolamina sp. R1-12]SFP89422.1 hypothetical protein SAMN05216277_11177 [Halolamina pelagica]